ncbi:MAG: lipid-A-disaccharide synthase [Gammaproteobacteria bacterium]|nr:lipid-A-disaccharide synthase [Gammaproteobacteria bacterium]
MSKPKRIAIVAGEVSGDIIASGFIREFKKHYPDAIFFGIAGPLMKNEGCDELFAMEKLAVMGFSEVLGRLREILGIRKQLLRILQDNPPDLFIGVDAPDFNLKLEQWLHHAGISTVHYVSPSVWAWRQYRVKKIARSVDLMLTLFPFEKAFYESHRVPVEFVGHPLADEVDLEIDQEAVRARLGLEKGKTYVALLPGSRMSEVTRLAEVFVDTARLCVAQRARLEFLVPFVSGKTRDAFESIAAAFPDKPVFHYFDGRSREVMAASSVVVLASGTATLEAMLIKRPMVVAYRVSSISYFIYKSLVKVKHVALPNLLAGEELVPELLQEKATPERISREVLAWLDDQTRYQRTQQRFEVLHKALRQNASECAAIAIKKMLE